MTARKTRLVWIVLLLLASMYFMISCVSDSCPSGCGDNGECANGICECDAGYTGDSCEIPCDPIVGVWLAGYGADYFIWTFNTDETFELEISIFGLGSCYASGTFTMSSNELCIIITEADPSDCSGWIEGCMSVTWVSDHRILLGDFGPFFPFCRSNGVDEACIEMPEPGYCYPDEDTDSDMICDIYDNCPNVKNLFQTDTDNDGIGDACE